LSAAINRPALIKRSLLCTLLTLLTGCSAPQLQVTPPTKEAIEQETKQQLKTAMQRQQQLRQRVANLSLPLFRAANELCPKPLSPATGLRLHHINDYPEEWQPAARELYQLNNSHRVIYIVAGSAADQAGVKPGDQILAVNEVRIQQKQTTRSVIELIKEQSKTSKALNLQLLRDGTQLSRTVTTEELCQYPVLLSGSDAVNAFADGSKVTVTKGLLRYNSDDQGLTLIIAHEIAHNIMDHIPKRTKNALLSGLLDIVAISGGLFSPGIATILGSHRYTQEFEIEADLIGLRLMHKAGYDITHAADLWRRMGSDYPSSITHGRQLSHPTTAERYLLLKRETEKLLNKAQQESL